jgi:hypothetical protein
MGAQMKQGASKLRKLPGGSADNLAELPARTTFDSSVASRAIPIDLRPVIQAYRKRGRFMLRIEKLPQQARFSAGQNNGDGSWSLQLDELEELVYFAPKTARGEHALSIRLVAKDEAEAFTIALVDYPIAADREAGPIPGPHPVDNAREERHPETEELKTALAAREAELNQLRASAERMGVLLQQKVDLAVEEAETKWKREQAKRLEEERAQLEEQFERRLAEREVRAQAIADIGREQQSQSLRRMAQEFGTIKELLASRDGELAASRTEVERLRKDRDSDIAAAKAAATAQMAEALKSAQIEWQARADTALAQMTLRCETAEKALAETKSGGRAEVKDLRGALDAERKRSEQEIAAVKAAAEAEAAKSLKAAESEWQKRVEAERAELVARCETAEKALAAADAGRGDRDAELRELRLALEGEQKRSKEQVSAARAAAEADAARILKDAEADWQKRAEAERAGMAVRCEAAEKSLAAATAAQNNRDEELHALRAAMEAERKRSEEQIAAARRAAAAEAAKSLENAEAAWQKRADTERASMAARCDAAEKALAAATIAQGNRDGEVSALRLALEAERKRSNVEIAAAKEAADLATGALKEAQANLQAQSEMSQGDSETELVKLRAELQRQQDLAQAEIAAAKVMAEDRAGLRLLAAQAQWEKESAAAIATLTARCEMGERALAAAGSNAEHEAEMEALQAEMEKLQQKAESDVAAAKAAADQAVTDKLKAAQALWEKETRAALTDAQERCDRAESALASARRAATPSAEYDAYVQSLEREIKTLRATLVDREASIAQAQAHQDQLRLGTVRDPPGARWNPLQDHSGAGLDDRPRRDRPSSKMFRDIMFVVVAAAAAVFFLPRLEAMLPNDVRWQIETLGGLKMPSDTQSPVAQTASPGAAVTPRAEQKSVFAQHDVNVRVEPSTSSAIAGGLKRGDQAVLLEERANWDRVRVTGTDGKSLEGWVYNTFLGANSPVTASDSTAAPNSEVPSSPAAAATPPPASPVATPASTPAPKSAPARISAAPKPVSAPPVTITPESPVPADLPEQTQTPPAEPQASAESAAEPSP